MNDLVDYQLKKKVFKYRKGATIKIKNERIVHFLVIAEINGY